MNSAIESMLQKYECRTTQDYKNALKEIIQEIALLGLQKAGFFRTAAFYGGSALRIFYGLERFSEDLDFSLIRPDSNFSIESYTDAVKEELAAYGFNMEVIKKVKAVDTNIDSAFIKGGTLFHLLQISSIKPPVAGISENEMLKIKMEVDINPPDGAHSEIKYSLIPIPYNLKIYTLSSLFAGKIHSILCRKWKTRIKGRDLFDYVWYLSNNVPVNLFHLSERMKQSGHLDESTVLSFEMLQELLTEKFSVIDFKQAVNDVKIFIKDQRQLEVWSADFFKSITKDKLKSVDMEK
jgi:predicted nucleotidyltransferase component of viral defense system